MYSSNALGLVADDVEVGHRALLEAQPVVDAIADGLLVLLGDAEEHADRAHGHLGAEVADEVEAAGAHERIERAAQNSRTFGSIAFILRGVNTRDSRPRCRSWWGGSSKIIDPGGISMPLLISSRMVPLAELYVRQSTRPRSTSANRLRA